MSFITVSGAIRVSLVTFFFLFKLVFLLYFFLWWLGWGFMIAGSIERRGGFELNNFERSSSHRRSHTGIIMFSAKSENGRLAIPQ